MTYIRRELEEIEKYCGPVARYAHQPWPDTLVDEADKEEKRKTRYLKAGGWAALVKGLIKTSLLRPLAFFRAVRLSCQLARRSDRSFVYHLAYLAEACILRDSLLVDKIEHLHIHHGTNSSNVGMLAHVLGGPPYSITFHGPEEFDRAACSLLHEKIGRSTFVVAVSSFGRSQLMRWCSHVQWAKINVVHCNVNDDYLESNPPPWRDSNTIACVGRLCEQKGQLLLIEAVGMLVREGVDVQLRLVGDGPFRPECEAAIRQHGVAKNVTITGWATGEEVRKEIHQARGMVLPSFAEGLPVVLMEALALERPVISTYIAGIPELVIPGENGWLVPAGSVEALVQAIRELLQTPIEQLHEMGRAGRTRVIAEHQSRTEAAKLLALVQQHHSASHLS